MATVSYPIANTADDVLQFGSFGLYDTNVSNGFNGGVQVYAGLRFLAVAVPQGADVSEAYIDVVKDAANSTAGSWGAIRGVAADNAPAWTITNPQAAAKTTAATTIADGATQRIYVTAQVREIVSRAGWASGNAMAFAGDPTSATAIMAWVDRATSSTNCAQLSITYSTGGPDVTPPTITSSATPSVVEGSALSHALTANETVTWEIVGGADAALFSLTGSTLSLPAQTYSSGPFEVVVRATDTSGNETDQTITVSITEAPPWSLIGANQGTTSATIPAHQAGDLILAFAYRDGSNTLPTLPTGQNWTSLQAPTGANTNSHRLVAKIATSSSEATGTFTSATTLIVLVFRPKAGYTLSWGLSDSSTGASTTVAYAALSIAAGSGVVAFAGHRSTNTSLETPPAGMVLRSNPVDGTDEAAAFDTDGPVSSWSGASVPVGGTSSGWRSTVVEIVAAAAITARPTFQAFIID